MATKHRNRFNFRVGIGRGEVPPENGAIGSTSVESWWVVKCGGGGDFVRWRCIWPYTRHGSALHGLFSSGVHMSESVTSFFGSGRDVEGEVVYVS